MSEKDNGGPAFPQNDAAVNRINNEAGMTLRDWFAGQALAGLLSAPQSHVDQASGPRARSNNELAAKWSYETADAMLAERAK